MKRFTLLLGIAIVALPLAACVEDGYGYGVYSTTPYYGWYDGYYGSIYDGYWGADNFFYFRLTPNDRAYRRGDRQHFRKEPVPGGRFDRFEGTIRQPPQGTRMPHYPHDRQQGQPRQRNDREDGRRDLR
jgi:hypothetical protein